MDFAGLKPMYVLYHRDNDGFGAAWAAWLQFGDRAEYISVQYGEKMPKLEPGTYIYIVDFCVKEQELKALIANHKSVVVIDHHKTSADLVKSIKAPNFAYRHDISKSGCELSWEEFHGDDPIPELLSYIGDMDLWKWELPYSKEVNAAIDSYPTTFSNWSIISKKIDSLKLEGASILRYIDAQVTKICKRAELVSFFDEGIVPMVGSTEYISRIGNDLCDIYSQRKFAVVFFDFVNGDRVFLLRSKGDFDVSGIAEKYGGGGHKNAAGFKKSHRTGALTPEKVKVSLGTH